MTKAITGSSPKAGNPTLINGHEIPRGERVPIAPDEKISICSFVLRIQPK
jgi:hypothetical protein